MLKVLEIDTARVQIGINVISSLRLVPSLQIRDLRLHLKDNSQGESDDATLELVQSVQDVLSRTLSQLEITSGEPLDAGILQPLF